MASPRRSTGCPTRDIWEEDFELGVEQGDVASAEDLGHKGAPWDQHVGHNGQGCQDQLALHKLVHVVQPRDCGGRGCREGA